jgi:carboxypeptidase PM20D1
MGELADPNIPGIAVIGVAEKGYISLQLDVVMEGGHSSMPKSESSIGVLSRALIRIEENQMPARVRGTIFEETLRGIAPYLGFIPRVLVGNLWLFESLVIKFAAAKPSVNAQLRTTTAFTILRSGNKDNVLPSQAYAVINFRVLPGDTSERIIEHLTHVVNDDRVGISKLMEQAHKEEEKKTKVHEEEKHPLVFGSGFSSPVSSTSSSGWKIVDKTVKQEFNAPVVPYLVVGATDAR